MAIGWFVDRELGSSPVFTLIGLGLGIVGAGAATWSVVRDYFRN
jgi:F0F1-type ATP synthase assembly protein I